MNPDLLLKIIFVSIMSLMFSFIVFSRYDEEVGSEAEDSSQRYKPYIPGALLPCCLIIINILALYYYGIEMTAHMTLSMYVSIFIHICLYYAILMPLLPLLRKYISARAISMMWMIPNYLYLMEMRVSSTHKPLFVFQIDEKLLWTLFAIAMIGFIIVILWKFIEHLYIRFKLLKDSKLIDDPNILKIWNEELERGELKKVKYKLVSSLNTSIPLSIGLFKRTTKVILPNKNYTNEELSLIFRHEIIHIEREDVWSKFFLIFCTALCWYNPFMWIAMRKCSDDIELSCDETVLLDADEETRIKYGHLLLDNAYHEQGFTTCLSASSKAMQYRITNIAKPRKRHTGAIIVGLTFFALCMTCGFTSIAYGNKTGKEIVYESNSIEEYHLDYTTLYNDEYNTVFKCIDEKAFHEYISSLTMSNITGNYSFNEDDKRYTFLYKTPKGTLGIVLSEEIIKLTPLYEKDPIASYYYLPDKVDWEYLESILIHCPALNINLKDNRSTYGKHTSAALVYFSKIIDNETKVIYEIENKDENLSGIFGSNYRPYEATLDFSYKNIIDYTVTIETWDYSSIYKINRNDLKEDFVIQLPNTTAHYTFNVTYKDNNDQLCEAVFVFNIGDID